MSGIPAKKGLSRVWLMDGGAGPTIAPDYLALAAAGGVEKGYGDVTRIEAPSKTERGAYDVIGEFQSGEENATLGLTVRKVMDPSKLLKVANKKCIADFQVHFLAFTHPPHYTPLY